MTLTVDARYDGRVLRPDTALSLKPNTRVQVTVTIKESPCVDGKAPSFLELAETLQIEGPPDWSTNLDK